MPQLSKTRRTGRKRWTELVRFLTKAMYESKNEKVRMSAAMRLADILTLREQREIAELRATERKGAGDPGDTTAPTEPEAPKETAEEAAARFLESILRQRGVTASEQ